MASTTTTNMTNTFKQEMMCATHNFSAQINVGAATGTTSSNLTALTAANTPGIVVGSGLAGTNVAANCVVAALVSQTAINVYPATTGAPSALLVNGDIFKILMIGSANTGSQTYGQLTQNVGTPGTGTSSTTNVGTDEVGISGSYAAGGQALASNTTPTNSSNVAFTTWSTNPQWTSATLSVIGAIIYNTGTTLTGAGAGSATAQPRQMFTANGITANLGGSAVNRAVSSHDFGGTQAVSNGTMTLTLPTASSSTAILRIA